MFEKIKLKNIIDFVKMQNVYKGSRLKGGAILDVHFRRNLLETTTYNFAGICIAVRNRGLGSSIIVRNVITLYTLEYTFNIFSPLVNVIIRSSGITRKAKLYYLRSKPAPLSKINFQYITKIN